MAVLAVAITLVASVKPALDAAVAEWEVMRRTSMVVPSYGHE